MNVVLWDKRNWLGELVDSGDQMITCRFLSINQDLTWYLSAVHAEYERIEKRNLCWNYLLLEVSVMGLGSYVGILMLLDVKE